MRWTEEEGGSPALIVGGRGEQATAQAGEGRHSDTSCGWEWVGLFSCVDILRCFLVVLLCVSSVRTFFLN